VSETVEEEIKALKTKVNYLERYYHSNLKYIKQLYAEIDKLKKEKNNNVKTNNSF